MHTRTRRQRPALTLLAAALTAAGAVTVATPVASHADTQTVAVAKDKGNDAVVSKRKGITRAQKKSIDMRAVTVQRLGNQARFIIAVRDVQRGKKFDQMFHITWAEQTGAAADRWVGDIWFSTKVRYAEAAYSSPDYESYEGCNAPIAIRPKREEVVVTVPWRCVPEGPLKIKVSSSTGHYRTDAPTWSRDNAYFAGKPVVLPN